MSILLLGLVFIVGMLTSFILINMLLVFALALWVIL